jgi:signal transduction histidine kinase
MKACKYSFLQVGRWLAVMAVVLVYLVLLCSDAWVFFPRSAYRPYAFLQFGLSALAALLFLAVGALVWLYARRRGVALLLLCFCTGMMMTFIVQTGAAEGDLTLSVIGGVSGVVALLFFSTLLLVFPQNVLAPLPARSQLRQRSGALPVLLRWLLLPLLAPAYLGLVVLLSLLVSCHLAFYDWGTSPHLGWLNFVDYTYYLLTLCGILTSIAHLYRRTATLREQQQHRLFMGAVILAFTPFLLLNVLPWWLRIPLAVDPRFSTLPLALLPPLLGYSILRYQILVLDRYIRRAVAWIVGVVGLLMLAYGTAILSLMLPLPDLAARTLVSVTTMAVLAPLIWWLAQVLTERLFFSEIIHYRRLVEVPHSLESEGADLNKVARLLTVALVNAFETREVCLFVLDEESGYYRLCPALSSGDPLDEARLRLLGRLFPGDPEAATNEYGWLTLAAPLIERLALARFPFRLSELASSLEREPVGLARYLQTTVTQETLDPLLVPVRAQGRLIGALVLGARGDHQPYAGPDFEAIELILARFSPMLETARLYAQASRHTAMLNALYSVNALPMSAIETIEDVAVNYAEVAARAVSAGAEVWLYNEEEDCLERVASLSGGPPLSAARRLTSLQEPDWRPWFYESNESYLYHDLSSHIPPCLPQTPRFPFAWLPLRRAQRRLGVLVLTYSRAHVFSCEEKHILEMFACQCATMLENAKITLELKEAYEQQKELDRLKDQFIMTASHELRTPLTAVLGYIELLKEYHLHLSPEVRADFIARAHRGCDELVLLVSNIMDASRVHLDAEHMQLESVDLLKSVEHVVEILDALSKRERHTLRVSIPAGIYVLADELRLRQILLNLISNALKYSPPGTDVEINSRVTDERVTVSVRDYGLGVPPEAQKHLFERFVRLDRDMNSPVRGAGLGLYISEQLVQAMGGRIWVESSGVPGEGSTFSFALQRAPQPSPLHQDPRSLAPGMPQEKRASSGIVVPERLL